VAGLFGPLAAKVLEAAQDGSYYVVRVEPVSGGNGRVFRHTLAQRRPNIQHNAPVDAFEVDLRSGMLVIRQTDLFVKDSMPLCLTRTYRAWDTKIHVFGVGTRHPYELTEYGTRLPYTYMDIVLEDYDTVHFERISKGTGFADAVYEHSATLSEFTGARIAWNGDGWTLALRDGRTVRFPEAYNAVTEAQAAVVEMRNAQGQSIRFDRAPSSRTLRRLISPSGHAIAFTYTATGQIDTAADDAGNEADYYYDAKKRLYAVSRTDGRAYRFAYDEDRVTTISDEKSRVLLEIAFENGLVVQLRAGDGRTHRIEYATDAKGTVVQARVTSPDGSMYVFDHGALVSK